MTGDVLHATGMRDTRSSMMEPTCPSGVHYCVVRKDVCRPPTDFVSFMEFSKLMVDAMDGAFFFHPLHR